MKKTSAIIILAATLLTFTSCGNKSNNSETREKTPAAQAVSTEASTESTEPTTIPDYHERHNYDDGVLVGNWKGDFASLEFSEEGSLSLLNDISEIIMFTNDKTIMFNGNEYPQENVVYDGTSLKVVIPTENGENVELLNAERNGDANPDNLDGEYDLTSGFLAESLLESAEETETKMPDTSLTIRNGHCFITIKNFCKYSQNADVVEFSDCTVDPSIMDYEFGRSTFTLNDDGSFTLYDVDGNTETFEKEE